MNLKKPLPPPPAAPPETKTPAAASPSPLKTSLDAAAISKRQHAWFVDWFCWACERVTGDKYTFAGKEDAAKVKFMLDSLGLEILVNRASYYLTLPDELRFPRGSPNIHGLKIMLNQIAGKGSVETDRLCIALGILPADNDLAHFAPWKEDKAA